MDLFTSEQAKRIFGFIALGGTAGAMCGSWFAKTFAEKIGSATLLLVALVMLEASVQCFKRLEARQAAEPRASEPLGESQQSAAATAAAPAAARETPRKADPRRRASRGCASSPAPAICLGSRS